MKDFELFSRRGKPDPAAGEYIYDEASKLVRNHFYNFTIKILRIIGRDYIGDHLEEIVESYFYETGQSCAGVGYDVSADLIRICGESPTTEFIDFIDIVCRYVYETYESWSAVPAEIHKALEDLNYFFRKNSFGYQIVNGQIARFDQQTTYEKIVKPVMEILHNNKFKGAEEELKRAYDHYNNGRNEDAIVNANKAFESAMKTICINENYSDYSGKETVSELVNLLGKNNFFPTYLQSNMSGVKNILSNGVSNVRNKKGAHGAGQVTPIVDDEFVEFAINAALTNILFLVRLYERRLLTNKP